MFREFWFWFVVIILTILLFMYWAVDKGQWVSK